MINALNNFLPAGAERVLMAGGSILGGALSFAFGDVGPLLVWLLVFTVTDFFLVHLGSPGNAALTFK